MTNSRALKAVLFSFLFTIFGSSVAKTIEIKGPFLSVPSSMEKVSLFHDEDGFHVSQNDETHSVEKCWVDPSLQNISSKSLKEFLVTGYISVSQMDNGEFSLQAKNLIKGGGLWGAAAGVWIGRAVVSLGAAVVVTTAGVIGHMAGGPVGAGIAAKATATYIAPIVVKALLTAQVAGGLIGGMVTGPV